MTANRSLPDPDIGTPEFSDSPNSLGNSGPLQQLKQADSFSTYLMYKPTGGVWIALKQIDWSWSETATKSGGSWTAPTSAQPAPTSKTPSGDDVFPTWVNTANNYKDKTMNPSRAGSPGP